MTDGAGNHNHYLFDLARPVSEFSLDLYDYVGDGGAKPLDSVKLRAFSDLERTLEVASTEYVVPRPRPNDGMAVNLSVSTGEIRSLTLEFSTFDRGTGIDNIEFVTIPEPASAVLLILALLLGQAIGRRI